MKRIVKHRGLMRHAQKLGVSAGHLSQVLSGSRRGCDELIEQYRKLVASELDTTGTSAITAKRYEPSLPIINLPAGTSWKFDTESADRAICNLGDRARREGNTVTLLVPIRVRGLEILDESAQES